jgi:hypothetical protein
MPQYYQGNAQYQQYIAEIQYQQQLQEIKQEEKFEEEDAKNASLHFFLISSIVLFFYTVYLYLFWFVMFLVHHWYTIFICVILLPIPEYASKYTDNLGNMTSAIVAPVNMIFIPTLNQIFQCLKIVLDLYNHVVAIIRAILHQVIADQGPPNAQNIFAILNNLFLLARFIVEMFGTALLSAMKFFMGLLTGNFTIDFTFIEFIVEFFMKYILHLLDPYGCFDPPDLNTIPYTVEVCLSRQQTPPLNYTQLKSQGFGGLVKGLVIIFCGQGSLNDDTFTLLVNCTGMNIVFKIRDNAVYDYNLALNRSIELKNNLDSIKNQLSTINGQLEALIPKVVDYALNKLCGALKNTIFCTVTRKIVNSLANQILHSGMQTIDQPQNISSPINSHHGIWMDGMHLVNDTEVCFHRRDTGALIWCIHSTPSLNRLHDENGHYINFDSLIDKVNTLVMQLEALDLENRLPTPFRDYHQKHDHASHTESREIPIQQINPHTAPSFNDLRQQLAQNYSYGGENSTSDVTLTLLEQSMGLLNLTVQSLRRGYSNETYFWFRKNMEHNKFVPGAMFSKLRTYYDTENDPTTMHNRFKMAQRGLDIQITVLGAISSFVIYGGSTFSSLIGSALTLLMGVVLASSYIFGMLGSLLNAIEGVPGLHFDFGFNALSIPAVNLVTAALNAPVDTALTDDFLPTYAVLIFEIAEVTVLNVIRMVVLCNFPASLGPLTCPPEVVADFSSPSIGTVSFDYLRNLTMCSPDFCNEGDISSTGAICVNGNFLCWPTLPYILIPPIQTQTDSDLSACTISGVMFNAGVAWYRVCWNWVAVGFQQGLKFTLRILIRGYSFPWFLTLTGFFMTRICMCCKSAGNALLYLTILQLVHYPLQHAGELCPAGRLWGLCDYYQDYILFDKLDNDVPPDDILCNALALPVYILAYFEVVVFLYLGLIMLNTALLISVGKDLVMIFDAISKFINTMFFNFDTPYYTDKKQKMD